MFALSLAPLLLHQGSLCVPGLIVGWLLQWAELSAHLPLYELLCAGVVLKHLHQEIAPDLVLLALVPALFFLATSTPTFIALHVLTIATTWNINRPVAWDALLPTVFFVQAPLRGLPYSALRGVSLLLWQPSTLLYTSLWAACDGKSPMHVLGAYLVVLWSGSWLEAVLIFVGVAEWVYYIRHKAAHLFNNRYV